jgi:large subunit ribosomal protein L21
MYAIIEMKGKQYRVQEGDTFSVARCGAAAGDEIAPERVLLVGGENTHVGTPSVEGAKVQLKVLRDERGVKIRGFKYRSKSGYKRSWGHRDELTVLRVEKIEV